MLMKVGRWHIVAIATMAVFTFGWLFTGRYLWLLTLTCALDWYIVNLVNRHGPRAPRAIIDQQFIHMLQPDVGYFGRSRNGPFSLSR